MTAEEQINKLAAFIMSEIDGEPSRNEGAVDTAIRLLEKVYKKPKKCVCGSSPHVQKKRVIGLSVSEKDFYYHVECSGGGGKSCWRGPESLDRVEAINLWNTVMGAMYGDSFVGREGKTYKLQEVEDVDSNS